MIAEHLGSFTYNPKKNNFWGMSFKCLDDRRLFCSCELHDEVCPFMISRWLSFHLYFFLIVFIVCFGLFKNLLFSLFSVFCSVARLVISVSTVFFIRPLRSAPVRGCSSCAPSYL